MASWDLQRRDLEREHESAAVARDAIAFLSSHAADANALSEHCGTMQSLLQAIPTSSVSGQPYARFCMQNSHQQHPRFSTASRPRQPTWWPSARSAVWCLDSLHRRLSGCRGDGNGRRRLAASRHASGALCAPAHTAPSARLHQGWLEQSQVMWQQCWEAGLSHFSPSCLHLPRARWRKRQACSSAMSARNITVCSISRR